MHGSIVCTAFAQLPRAGRGQLWRDLRFVTPPGTSSPHLPNIRPRIRFCNAVADTYKGTKIPAPISPSFPERRAGRKHLVDLFGYRSWSPYRASSGGRIRIGTLEHGRETGAFRFRVPRSRQESAARDSSSSTMWIAISGNTTCPHLRDSVTRAKGSRVPSSSWLSIRHSQVSVLRSYLKVLWMAPPSGSRNTNGIESPPAAP